jgi:guanidinoacetate N-methyltransferase
LPTKGIFYETGPALTVAETTATATAEPINLFFSNVTNKQWRNANVSMKIGENGKDDELRAFGEIVMRLDEEPYMRELAKVVTRAGRQSRVLEIGFGMGISAGLIAEQGCMQHVIVEANIEIMKRCLAWTRVKNEDAKTCILGFWEEVVPMLRDGSFDGIIFDPFPAEIDFPFVQHALRLLRPGGVLTFYLQQSSADDVDASIAWAAQVKDLLAAGFLDEEILAPEIMKLNILTDCGPLETQCPHKPMAFVVPTVIKSASRPVTDPYVQPEDRRLLDEEQSKNWEEEISRIEKRAAQVPANAGGPLEQRPRTRSEWQAADAIYANNTNTNNNNNKNKNKNNNNNDDNKNEGSMKGVKDKHNLWIFGHMVMDTEEDENMRDLARVVTASKGRVLEVGFGMGISAGYMQEMGVQQHVIIEANSAVMTHMLDSFRATKSDGEGAAKVVPILGFWQEVTPFLRSEAFGGALFDPFPNDNNQLESEVVHQLDFMAEAHRLLEIGGIFSYMSGTTTEKAIARDTRAAEAGGFLGKDISIHSKEYLMVDVCDTYPDCRQVPLPLLVPRLVKTTHRQMKDGAAAGGTHGRGHSEL